jgi:endonuclease/exonuclease/phosphatase family metal-dependent hydrolase
MASASSGRWVPLAAVLVVVWLVAFLRALTRIFALNFSTAGPNATGLLALLLVTGWTIPVAARLAGRPRVWHATVLLVVAGLLGSVAAETLVALTGALVSLTAATPLLVALVGRLQERFAFAAATGLVGYQLLRAVLDTAPPYATLLGRVALIVLGLAVVAGWWLGSREGLPTGDGEHGTLAVPGGATAVAFLFAQVGFLGLAPRVALWSGRPYLLTLAAAVAGFVGGALLVARRGGPGRAATVAASVVLVGSLAALLSVAGPGIAMLPAALATVLLVARGSRPGTTGPRRVGAAVAGVQVVGLVLVTGIVFAMNWAFVPGGWLLRGRAPVVVLLLGVLLSVIVLVRELRPDRADAAPARPTGTTDTAARTSTVSGGRRSLLSAAGGGLLAMASAGYHGTRPTDGTAAAEPLTALSFNIHLYLDSDGEHNLGAVRDLIRESGAGVVGLQETAGGRLRSGGLDGVRWLAHELGYHAAVGPPTRLASYGVALLSAWPIREERVVVPPERDSATRIALAATVESPLGPLPVVVTHLETAGDVRVAQAERVVDLIRATGDPDRALVLGDLNATPDERPYEVFSTVLDDPWAGSAPGADTYSAADPRRRIDYALVGRGWEARRGEVIGSPTVSDHLGVSVTVRPDGE